ncbi:TPA: hypothetical protein ACF5GV_002787 [Staphylococcus aureus]|jgi:hypothetical protein|uniref:hypothetical protein n=1 Tax=Staphylococcus TaxID=1279 RepID=UPI0005DB2FD5|nr:MULTISPECIES: hypothetical protein [Staphylococcus]CFH41724.1 Uncharacterised protein [Staphylococcus aureus]
MDIELIIKILDSEGIELTSNIDEAIYILADGRMVSGMFDCGVRGIDHRVMEILFEDVDRDSENFWDEVLNRACLVMYVPETKTVLIKRNQNITDEQLKIINNLENQKHSVEYF